MLVEAEVGTQGRVTDPHSVAGDAPFVAAAVDVARRWTFRPACRRDRAVPALVYLVFGFREPVVAPAPPEDGP